MYRVFQSFVDALSEATGTESVHDALTEVAGAFDFSLFAYFSVPTGLNAGTRLISNYSEAWTSRYLRRRYHGLDPVILRAETDTDPFLWGEAEPHANAPEQARFFHEAAIYGIRHGLTVPVHAANTKVAAVTFAGDNPSISFRRSAQLHARTLQLMAILLHRQTYRLFGRERTVNGIALTSREFECLVWAARGKSAWDISRILGVSRRTAAFHLDNARAKLGVRTRTQAVALLAASRTTLP